MCWSFNTQKKLRLYALNRVSLIRQMIKWTTGETENLPLYHIDGSLNPSDLLTKPHDITPKDLTVDSPWQSGLDWMKLPFEQMPLKSYADLRLDAKIQQEVDKECFKDVFLPTVSKDVHGIFNQKLAPSSVIHCSGCQTVTAQVFKLPCYGTSMTDEFEHCNSCECPLIFSASPEAGRSVSHLPIDITLAGGKD